MGAFGLKQTTFLWMTLAALCLPLAAQAAGVDPFVEDVLPELNHRIVINVPARTLTLYSHDKIVKVYPVGVGRPGFPTPTGHYHILCKVNAPGWENPYLPHGKVRIKPGRDNPLGSRWMGFKDYHGGQFGIHGTNEPTSVGKFSSHGCVRMHTHDAEKVFAQIDIGTPVDVVYDVAPIVLKDHLLHITWEPDVYHHGLPTAAQLRASIHNAYPTAIINTAQLTQALHRHASLIIATVPLPQAVTQKPTPPAFDSISPASDSPPSLDPSTPIKLPPVSPPALP